MSMPGNNFPWREASHGIDSLLYKYGSTKSSGQNKPLK
jgi:hypothetical protein